jgi:nitrate/nitrite transport system permease protein
MEEFSYKMDSREKNLSFPAINIITRFIHAVLPELNLKKILFPVISFLGFMLVWQLSASYLYNIEADRKVEKALSEGGPEAADEMINCLQSGNTSCQPNTLPSPSSVLSALQALIADHQMIRQRKTEFTRQMAPTNTERQAQGLEVIKYTGRPSFFDQIFTSLITVFAGCTLAIFIAIPIGIIMGLSPGIRNSVNWMIQLFKPVSPVVWLLLVFMIVKTVMRDANIDKSFIISFVSVGLCAMWATLVNTSHGVSSVHKDYINVARVLQLSLTKKIFKVILPSAMPLIFTGLRITVSVAWMVLIAIELLAQSPGLGSFIWEEFQNGASDSNAKIIVAMLVIGVIGFLLDRTMVLVQKAFSYNLMPIN